MAMELRCRRLSRITGKTEVLPPRTSRAAQPTRKSETHRRGLPITMRRLILFYRAQPPPTTLRPRLFSP